MKITDVFLEKWYKCKNSRYPVMLVSPSAQDLFSDELIEELTNLIRAELFIFSKEYSGRLEMFLTWQKIKEILSGKSFNNPLMTTGLEPFYSKWSIEERYNFLRYILRMESGNGIVLVLYCQEDLAMIKDIGKGNRGIIWTP